MRWDGSPLLGHLRTPARDADAVVPRTERGYHPLCPRTHNRAAHRLPHGWLMRARNMVGLLEDVRVRCDHHRGIEAFGDCGRPLADADTPAGHGDLETFPRHQL